MTRTLDAPPTSPAQRAAGWSTALEDALRARDVDRAAGLSARTSFRRDLVAFSRNLTTVEDRAGVTGLLTATRDRTGPTGSAVSEEPEEADGVTTAWSTFETAVGRGKGLVRLVEERGQLRAWTFLTTLYEPKGHEEPRGLGSDTTKDPGPWEGEQRNTGKPTQQEAPWFHGGNLHQSRHYSLHLALRLTARHAGIPTPVYGLAEAHHRR